jgi:hypothetical protein
MRFIASVLFAGATSTKVIDTFTVLILVTTYSFTCAWPAAKELFIIIPCSSVPNWSYFTVEALTVLPGAIAQRETSPQNLPDRSCFVANRTQVSTVPHRTHPTP